MAIGPDTGPIFSQHEYLLLPGEWRFIHEYNMYCAPDGDLPTTLVVDSEGWHCDQALVWQESSSSINGFAHDV